ncbi:MAG: tetratricopeptide repeat protein [Candidatus Omnitrophota bacterium]|nr:MAG: tetratricopeptide repeat protein [Candidatus Omnitrophota bacterium]
MAVGKVEILKRWPPILSLALIIILGFIIYSNSLSGEFVWDDKVLIRDNMYIRSFRHLGNVFTAGIGQGAGIEANSYRPLQMVSYMLGYAFWRLDVRGYHLLNILLHICVAVSIYWLIFILYRDKLLSFFTSILFVAHPIHTGAVTYISGGADPLAAVFMIICLIFYIRQSRLGGLINYSAAIICFILALSARENSLILPVLLLLYHYAFRKKVNTKLFLSLVTIAAAYILLRITVLKNMLPHIDASGHFLQRIPGVFVAITNYLRLLVIPANLHMEYGNRVFSVTDLKVITGVFLVVFFLTVAIRQRRNSLVFFPIMWFFITLVPVSNLYPLNAYMAEHWLYLPSVGFFLIAARVIKGARNKSLIVIISVAIVAFYSFMTIKQNNYWNDPVTLYQRTLKYAPASGRVYNNLGIAWRESKEYNKAIVAFSKAIKCNPQDAYTYNNLGLVYSDMGEKKRALSFYRKAVDIDSSYAQGFYNLGNIYTSEGAYQKAIDAYRKAIEINPYAAKVYCNLGTVYTYIGRNNEAADMLEKAIRINPYDADAYYNLGSVYAYKNEDSQAIKAYKKAIKNNPNYAEAYNNLAVVYLRQKNFKRAIQNYGKAKELGITNSILEESLKIY